MMAQKHLHELLMEDQEPFHLNNYISDRRCQLKTTRPKSSLQLNKIRTSSTSKLSMCKHACFFSFQDSPDVTISPFLPSPVKSPCKTTNTVFLQVPSRTATMLLEAAARIQKQSSAKPRSSAFGLFGSILKRLNKNRIKKREIGVQGEVRVSEDGKLTRKSEKVKENEVSLDAEIGFSCSCSQSKVSSVAWSESNEEKDMETSSCSSPFRFSLQKSPSTGRRTPEFSSPSSSPVHVSKEEEHNYEESNLQKEEEEAKEQCSPVSVLDPPFEDDEIRHEEGGSDDYDMECSYAIVEKVKQQLLHKLRRFERLAEWDPIELEKRMLEEQDDDQEEDLMDETDFADQEEEEESTEIIKDVFTKAYSHYYLRKIPTDINMIVLDLVSEENKNKEENSQVTERVCKRLESWKNVNPNTIDMMVELDFRGEIQGWKRSDEEEIRVTAAEIETGIFGVLMEELSNELVSLSGF